MNLTEVLLAVNESGIAIPLRVTSVAEVVPYQFALTLVVSVVGSLFAFYILWEMLLKNILGSPLTKYYLWRIKKSTKAHVLMIKHTVQDLFGGSMISQDDILKISKALQKFGGKPFILILHTPGGTIFSSLYISRLLKEYSGKIISFIPFHAMSGGTLLALSTNDIHMSDTSCLGPVDPQLGSLFRYGSARGWNEIKKFKGKKAEDQSLSFAMIGEQYTKSMSTHINYLLKDKMKVGEREKFVDYLVSGGIEHGKPLTKQELRLFGLEVKDLSLGAVKVCHTLITSNLGEGVTYI